LALVRLTEAAPGEALPMTLAGRQQRGEAQIKPE
jgi:hypothetical protein